MRQCLPLLFLTTLVPALFAQVRIGTGMIADTYAQYCAVCHGEELEGGGLGPSLVDGEWVHGSRDEDIARVIREGVEEEGMVGFKGVLTDQEVRAMVIYLREMGQLASKQASEEVEDPDGLVVESDHHNFRLEKVFEQPDATFWAVEFLPDGTLLLSERSGKLYLVRAGMLGEPVAGLPEIHARGQGGLMEVMPHPDYEKNGWIYISYSDRVAGENGRDLFLTAVVRGRIKDGMWVDQEDIFRADPKYYSPTSHHFGTRFVFKDGYLYFSIGERGAQDLAQDLRFPNGKIHRVHDDGSIPEDNPFSDNKEAYPTVWSYGHRNPQGLDLNPLTGELWETEHGPRGGDELNLIQPGHNYGWPVITYGMNYDGRPITDQTSAPGMEQPITYWTPSIAVCGIDFYEGEAFPEWKNDLFVTGLSAERLDRIRLDGTNVVEHEVVLRGLGRVRDVANGPDGFLYVILNHRGSNARGAVYRLVPVE